MSHYQQLRARLREKPVTWLVTGVAGFIGSNLLETLLECDQKVVGLDNFSTGHRANLEDVRRKVGDALWKRFSFHEADICSLADCETAVGGVDYVLHQAALGSVPRSLEDPLNTHHSNIDGFVNILDASRRAGVKRFIYAASSSTYGDEATLPKMEDRIGKPLSPYAVTKYVNELYADVFARCYGMQCIGLRYFNVFGPRQDPNGAYAAVIPRWFGALLAGDTCHINGDGETSRDFCYIDNTIQANLLAACASGDEAVNQVYNVAVGDRTTLSDLFTGIRDCLCERGHKLESVSPLYGDFRSGDVRHSQADITKASTLLGYQPIFNVHDGLGRTADWFVEQWSGRR